MTSANARRGEDIPLEFGEGYPAPEISRQPLAAEAT